MGFLKVRESLYVLHGYADLGEGNDNKAERKLKQARQPRRIMMEVPVKSPYWATLAAGTPLDVLAEAFDCVMKSLHLPQIGDDLESILLIKHVWTDQIHITFDAFNDAYDPTISHLPGRNDLDVWVVRFGKTKLRAEQVPPFLQADINMRVADAHNLNGWESEPPFFEDHTKAEVPYYPRPRDAYLLRAVNSGELQL